MEHRGSDHPTGEGSVDLNQLVAESAKRLMAASLQSEEALCEKLLAYICENFSVAASYYRRNDRDKRQSILVAEWPQRARVPTPDPVAVIGFDDNLAIGLSEHLKQPLTLVPGELESAPHRYVIAKAAGLDEVTVIFVPLTTELHTEGLIALVRAGHCPWRSDEILALESIAAMFMQTQSRLMAERALRRAAFIDTLTGLPNRQGVFEAGSSMLDNDVPIAVIQIELEDLRTVNDTLGRQAGDKLILQFATALRAHGTPLGWCGRINGNGFGILMQDTGDDEELFGIARRLFAALRIPVQIGERHITLTLDIGIAKTYDRDIDIEALFQEANAAIQSLGAAKGNKIILFDQELARKKSEQVELEVALRDAVTRGEQIIVHYQPEVDLRTGELVGCEALARWQHPTMGLLAAGRFIEMAERTGLVVPLSKQVMESAIAQQAAWMREDPSLDTTIRINVSPAQLMGTDLAIDISGLLLKYALPAKNLCIEVTEHVVMDYSEKALGYLAKLQEMGVEIAIDDFGIGHSSIAKLKYMPADTLKIDRAFITSLIDGERDVALVDTIIRMASAFDMTVVAEGVETAEELTELLTLDADRGQGYFFAKPMSAEDVKPLFHQRLFDPQRYQRSAEQLAQG